MSWKNDLATAKEVFQTGTTKEKIDYILEYYKFHILVIAFAICFIGSMIHANVTAKESVLQGIFLNTLADTEAASELSADFLSEFPIDTSSEDIFFDTSLYYLSDSENASSTSAYETLQILMARTASGDIDFMAADAAALIDFAYDEYLYELSEVLSEEQMKKYEPYFLYYDKAVLEELNSMDFTAENVPEVILPDPAKPELMEEPVPVMIDITTSEKLSVLYPDSSKEYAFGFVANGKNSVKTLEFLDFLMD